MYEKRKNGEGFRAVLLKQRRENLDDSTQQPFENIHAVASFFGHFNAVIQHVEVVVPKLVHRSGFIHEYAAFKMKIQASEVQIYGTDGSQFIVTDEGF